MKHTVTLTKRPATLSEAKTLNTQRGDFVVMPYAKGGANSFLLWSNVIADPKFMKKMLVTEAEARGYDIDVLKHATLHGNLVVQFLLDMPAAPKHPAKLVVNAERVTVGRVVIANPCNIGFKPNEKRLAHLSAFVQAAGYLSGNADGLEKAFVDRLFAEGMIERHLENHALYRPTSGGRLWLQQHS